MGERLAILSQCILRGVSRGPATRCEPGKPGSFVIFQSSALGDMVCTTPMFRAIKKAHPENKVYVVGLDWVKDVVKDNPDVDGYISQDEDLSSLIEKVKKLNASFGCVATPNFKGLAALYLAGIPCISAPLITNGFSPPQTRFYRFLLRYASHVEFRFGEYVPRQYLKLLEPAGIISQDTSKHLGYSEQAKQTVTRFFASHSIDPARDLVIGISPSCGNKIKNWGGDKFARVAEYLVKKYGAKVVVISGPKDQEEFQEMMSALKDPSGVISGAEKFSIDELKALIAHLKLFIAVDTGPIYIAEAFNVPTVDIVGPIDEREQPPIGPRNRLVYLKDREPALHIFNARVYDGKEARRQSQEISAEMVIKEIDDLIAEISK